MNIQDKIDLLKIVHPRNEPKYIVDELNKIVFIHSSFQLFGNQHVEKDPSKRSVDKILKGIHNLPYGLDNITDYIVNDYGPWFYSQPKFDPLDGGKPHQSLCENLRKLNIEKNLKIIFSALDRDIFKDQLKNIAEDKVSDYALHFYVIVREENNENIDTFFNPKTKLFNPRVALMVTMDFVLTLVEKGLIKHIDKSLYKERMEKEKEFLSLTR